MLVSLSPYIHVNPHIFFLFGFSFTKQNIFWSADAKNLKFTP